VIRLRGRVIVATRLSSNRRSRGTLHSATIHYAAEVMLRNRYYVIAEDTSSSHFPLETECSQEGTEEATEEAEGAAAATTTAAALEAEPKVDMAVWPVL
jgi:hypothetical protein